MYLLWRKQGIQLIFNSRNGFTIQEIGEIETRLIRVNGWLKFQFLSQVALEAGNAFTGTLAILGLDAAAFVQFCVRRFATAADSLRKFLNRHHEIFPAIVPTTKEKRKLRFLPAKPTTLDGRASLPPRHRSPPPPFLVSPSSSGPNLTTLSRPPHRRVDCATLEPTQLTP